MLNHLCVRTILSPFQSINASPVLPDERFNALFTNSDFQVDESSEQFHLLLSAIKKTEGERQDLSKNDGYNTDSNNSEVSLFLNKL